MKRFLYALILSTFLFVPLAQAEYPERPVTFVVPWPPGDLEDVLTRMIADEFQETYGVPAAVVNKPGGGGGPFPGAVEVAVAPADGYTVGSFIIAVPTIGPNIGIPELSPNPFEPLGIFLTYPFVIAAGGDAPYNDMQGLAEHAKDNDVALGHFGAPLIPTRVTLALAGEMEFTPTATLNLLHPIDASSTHLMDTDKNDDSLVMKITYGEVDILFTGDIGKKAESRLIASGQDLRSEILKVPHHGSRTSSSAPFLDAVQPRYAIFSLGQGNRYQFPHADVVNRYRARECPMLRTDESGAITLRTDGTRCWIDTEL